MFSLKGRLKSTFWFEKLNALWYVGHLALILYIIYFLIFDVYLDPNKHITPPISATMLICLHLTLLFSLTTIKSHSDFLNKDKFHKNTLDYYLADLNPSKGSFVYNIVKERTSFHEEVLSPLLFTVLVFSLVFGIAGIFSKSEGSFIIPFYNLLLIVLSLFFGGALIDLCSVSSEKLNSFYELEDITLEDKHEFRQEIMIILGKEKRVSREDVMKVCQKIKKKNQKRKEELQLEDQYKSFKERTPL